MSLDSNFKTFCTTMFSGPHIRIIWLVLKKKKNPHALAEPQTNEIRITWHETQATVFHTLRYYQCTAKFENRVLRQHISSLMKSSIQKPWNSPKCDTPKIFKIFIVFVNNYLLRIFYVPGGTILEDTTIKQDKVPEVWLSHWHDYHLSQTE